MESGADSKTDWEELASRTGNGLEVTLLWRRDGNDVHVRVIDVRTDEAFELTVPRANALEAFYHPYAYAAKPPTRLTYPASRNRGKGP